jgi:hypothetical protein
MDACGTNKLLHWPKRCSYCCEDGGKLWRASWKSGRQREKSLRPRADAVMPAGSRLDIAATTRVRIRKLGNDDISLWVWHRATGIGFPTSGHARRTVHLLADESRASRSIHLRIANRLESSANLSSAPPADIPFHNNHSKPQEPPKCQKLSLPFPTPRAYNLAEMMSGVLDSSRNNHMQAIAKVKNVARPHSTRPLHPSPIQGVSSIIPTAKLSTYRLLRHLSRPSGSGAALRTGTCDVTSLHLASTAYAMEIRADGGHG